MNIEQFKKVVEFLRDELDVKPRRYSGRGMYGRECVGITCANPFEVVTKLLGHFGEQAIVAERDADPDEPETEEYDLFQQLMGVLDNVASDNMGRDMIVYFPDWEWTTNYRDLMVEYE